MLGCLQVSQRDTPRFAQRGGQPRRLPQAQSDVLWLVGPGRWPR